MKSLLLVSSIAATLAGCAPPPGGYPPPYENLRQISLSEVARYAASVKTDLVNETPQQVIEKGKKAIADTLKDPASAQFRNVRLVQYLDGVVICGEINGKNSYGGYVGFKDFVGGTNSGTMRSSDEAKYAAITAAANTGIDTACSGKPYTPDEKT